MSASSSKRVRSLGDLFGTARRNRSRTVVTTDTYGRRDPDDPSNETPVGVGRTLVNVRQMDFEDEPDDEWDPGMGWFERFQFFMRRDANRHARDLAGVDDLLAQLQDEARGLKPVLLHREVSSVANFRPVPAALEEPAEPPLAAD